MPKLVSRTAQPYVAIRRQVAMREIAIVIPPLLDDVFVWLKKRGIRPAGTSSRRYLIVDMKRKFEIDVAVPIAVASPSDKHIVVDFLPTGRYATLLHTGHPDGLQKAQRSDNAGSPSWSQRCGQNAPQVPIAGPSLAS
jgi:effector-binding domain-containing protein